MHKFFAYVPLLALMVVALILAVKKKREESK